MAPASTLPLGANSVKVGEFNFTAPANGAISLTGVVIHRSGVGSTADIANAYLYDGTNRLTSGRTFNSSTNDATFTLALSIPAGTTKTLGFYISIAASGTATAGDTNVFGIESASAVSAGGAAVTGNFPIRTNSTTLAGTSAGTLTVAKSGSLSNPKVGDREALVSSFQLSASTEDAWVNQVTLTQGGSIANSALSNFKLKQSGTVVASASGVSSAGRVALVFSPAFKIDRGNNRTFELYVDVDGRPADTISFYLEDTGDADS